MIHYYDPDKQIWRAIENPTRDDIVRILSLVRRPCSECDADACSARGPTIPPTW